MADYVDRSLDINLALKNKSVLLLGPRRTGKSQLIKHEVKPDLSYNLLYADTFRRLSVRPQLIREELSSKKNQLIVIDEIQKLPLLMDEVHAMIEEMGARFLLTGSSARKLKRSHTSLMAGRATVKYLHPFSYSELSDFQLKKILNVGSIPGIYFASNPRSELREYCGQYLKEEIMAEALVRKVENFSRFIEFAALSNGQILNFESLGSDAQVPARTIREYYQILVDTLMGSMLPPVRATKNRKSISTAKFYFFDVGIVNSLCNRKTISEKTKEFGDNLEHFIFLELKAYNDYCDQYATIEFWNDYNNGEVDFVINEEVAIEVKATSMVTEKHLKGLQNFSAKEKVRRQIIVSMDDRLRKIGKIEVLPVEIFLKKLWAGDIF